MSNPTDGATTYPELIPRASTRGLLLGLDAVPALGILASGGVILLGLILNSATGVLYLTPVWLTLGLSSLITVGDRKFIEWIPIGAAMIIRKITRQDKYKAKLLSPRPDGTLALPGRVSALRIAEDSVTGAAMIHDPNSRTLVAVARLQYEDFLLLSEAEKYEQSSRFAGFISTLSLLEGLWRIQILTRSVPDPGVGIATYWQKMRHSSLNENATAAYEELLESQSVAAERHEVLLAVSLDMRKIGKAIKSQGGGITGAVNVMHDRMITIENTARVAKLRVKEWYTRPDLAMLLRTAYDPEAISDLEHNPNQGRDISNAGPMAAEEDWTTYRTDTAIHKIMSVVWPGIPQNAGFLRPLIVNPGIRVSFSLLFEPIPRVPAMKEAKRQVINESIAAHEREKSGRLSTVLNDQDIEAADQHLADVAAGFTDVYFTGLVCVTADNEEQLSRSVEAVKASAAESACELRTMVAQQAGLFPAAALPLCIGIPRRKGMKL